MSLDIAPSSGNTSRFIGAALLPENSTQLQIPFSEGGNDDLAYGLAYTQGYRPEMEDAHCIELLLDPTTNTSLFSVFDGHGGRQVADLCAQHVVDSVRSSQSFAKGNLEEGLKEAFFDLDARVLGHVSAGSAGATATVALIQGDKLCVAGVGDSRCVLSHAGTAQILTVDHKPEHPQEKSRIEEAGGFVIRGRHNCNLNVSRAIGDSGFKQATDRPPNLQQVSPEPDIRLVTLGRHDNFMILACDGVWNSLPEQEVVAYVQRRLNLQHSLGAIAEGLVSECLQPHHTAYDNVTAIIVQFRAKGARPSTIAAAAAAALPVAGVVPTPPVETNGPSPPPV